MDSSVFLELLIIFILILLNGVFAGAEIAILSFSKVKLQQLAEENNLAAQVVLALRKQPERLLATVQIGITLVGVTAAAFGGGALTKRVEGWLNYLALPFLKDYTNDLAFGLVVLLVSYLSLVVGELVPKSLALRFAESYALFMGKYLHYLSWVTRPLVWFLIKSSNILLKPFGDSTSFMESRVSVDEVQHILEEAAKAGALDVRSSEIASRAVSFADLTAVEVMVPRHRIDAIPRTATQDELWTALLESGHSRMPVYDTTRDDIVGYITAKDVLSMARHSKLIVLEDLLRPAIFIPENMKAGRILQTMQQKRTLLLMVVDEHGGVSGLLTLEDLMEELVGEMVSEYDEPEELITIESGHEPYRIENADLNPLGREDTVNVAKSVVALVKGHAPIREVNMALDIDLPEDPNWSTIAGFCIASVGRLPESGTVIAAKDEVTLEVVEATPKKIRLVRVRKGKVL